MLNKKIRTIKVNGLNYILGEDDKPVRFKPWLGDSFSFLYDFFMRKSVFPKKFGADMERHFEIIGNMLKDVHGQRVLELATGSGSAIEFLSHDNIYTGTENHA